MPMTRYTVSRTLGIHIIDPEHGEWVKFVDTASMIARNITLSEHIALCDVTIDTLIAHNTTIDACFAMAADSAAIEHSSLTVKYNLMSDISNKWQSRAIIMGALLFIESLAVYYF